MKLTPIDIKKHSFNTSFRGFATEEVEAFLEVVARQWEETLDELDRAKRRIAELETEMRKYKEVESVLHQTLAQAQQSANGVVENAKREAELIRQEAEIKSQQLIERAKLEVATMTDDVRRLETQKREVIGKLRMLLSSQLELLNAFSDDEESFILQQFANRKPPAEPKAPAEPAPNAKAASAEPLAPPEPVAAPEPPASEPPKPQTIKIEVPVEPSYSRSTSKKTVNIDDILSGLE